eukprot:COSAG01_NODE_3974_length_5476_cov_20.885810_3_plen_90_part_00
MALRHAGAASPTAATGCHGVPAACARTLSSSSGRPLLHGPPTRSFSGSSTEVSVDSDVTITRVLGALRKTCDGTAQHTQHETVRRGGQH